MNYSSLIETLASAADRDETSAVLVVPYMWVGDFVRCHSVVRVLKDRWPNRPVDVLSTSLCAPLADYMPGVRRSIEWNLPRKRLPLAEHVALGARLRRENYGAALMMPRTWKSALAPTLAGIPVRTGFIGEMRFGLVTDWRTGERALPRMIDRCAALALPAGIDLPMDWPVPRIAVPSNEIAAWRRKAGVGNGPAVALAPGAVGPSKRWSYYAQTASALVRAGVDVWVVGGPGETAQAQDIVAAAGIGARDVTGSDLRDGIFALAGADVVISNDSGLLHVAAAIGTPSVGIFGPTSAWHYAPLNELAAIIETKTDVSCRPCHKPTCRMLHHRCMRDIPADDVTTIALAALRTATAQSGAPLAAR